MNFINIKSYLSKFQFTHYNIFRENLAKFAFLSSIRPKKKRGGGNSSLSKNCTKISCFFFYILKTFLKKIKIFLFFCFKLIFFYVFRSF